MSKERNRRTLRRKHSVLAELAQRVAKLDPFYLNEEEVAECFFCDAEEVLGDLTDHEATCLWRQIAMVAAQPTYESHKPPGLERPLTATVRERVQGDARSQLPNTVAGWYRDEDEGIR